jgi:hypothetical protein
MNILFIIFVLACLAMAFVAWDHRQKHLAAANELNSIKAGLDLLESEARKRASDILKNAEKQKSLIEAGFQESSRRLSEAEIQLAEKQAQITKAESLFAAMRRRIDGVGDEYILPIHDLLDGYADNFGHEKAGKRLKDARETSKDMVKEKKAVSCNWGNEAYKKDAIRLLLESFNAQVDVALEGIKNEKNAGKVMQEIRDVYDSLNDYGTRCMRATIEESYLKSRLEEAKWGAITAELRHKEREQQREMATRLREEAKVQREIERARKEYEEEEARTRRAMEKAEAEANKQEQKIKEEHDRQVRDMEKALKEAQKKSDEERLRLEAEIRARMEKFEAESAEASAQQRAVYEAEKAELEKRLAQAEAEGQRAESMAQKTKQGHVYIISNVGSFGDTVLKIGMTRRLDPQERIDELSDASVPFEFDIHAMIRSDDAPDLEYQLHKAFAELRMNKINHRKEFFRISIKEVRELLEARDIHAEWSMTAKAREYHETIIWQERMRKDPAQRRVWAEQFGARRIDFDDIEPSPPR